MTPNKPSAPVVRPRAVALLVVPALVLLVGPGCHNRRTSLRPVLVAPPPAPAVIAPDPCPSNAVISPGFDDGNLAPTLEPVTPYSPPSVLPGPADEPGLTPTGSPYEEPSLQGPAASWNTKARSRRAAPRAALRSRLQSFVKDPDDLFAPPKADRPWKYVVLHHSAHESGSFEQIDRDHRATRGWDGCGYHFVIGNGSESPDGLVEVAGRWIDQKPGTHCRNGKTAEVNEYGIGICLVGDLDRSPPTSRQVEAAQALVDYLRERYQIPAEHVGTHAALAGSPTICPGRNFPTASIFGSRSLASR